MQKYLIDDDRSATFKKATNGTYETTNKEDVPTKSNDTAYSFNSAFDLWKDAVKKYCVEYY